MDEELGKDGAVRPTKRETASSVCGARRRCKGKSSAHSAGNADAPKTVLNIQGHEVPRFAGLRGLQGGESGKAKRWWRWKKGVVETSVCDEANLRRVLRLQKARCSMWRWTGEGEVVTVQGREETVDLRLARRSAGGMFGEGAWEAEEVPQGSRDLGVSAGA